MCGVELGKGKRGLMGLMGANGANGETRLIGLIGHHWAPMGLMGLMGLGETRLIGPHWASLGLISPPHEPPLSRHQLIVFHFRSCCMVTSLCVDIYLSMVLTSSY